MSLIYRPAQAQDLATTEALVVTTINDLMKRHRFGPMATANSPNFQVFSLDDDPDGLNRWVHLFDNSHSGCFATHEEYVAFVKEDEAVSEVRRSSWCSYLLQLQSTKPALPNNSIGNVPPDP